MDSGSRTIFGKILVRGGTLKNGSPTNYFRDHANSMNRNLKAISQDQSLVIPVAQGDNVDFSETDGPASIYCFKRIVEDVLFALPRNLHWDKQKAKEDQTQQQEEGREAMVTLEEGDEDEEENEKKEEGLAIAWQYRTSVQQERLGQMSIQPKVSSTSPTSVFCHSYDLSGRMNDQRKIDTSKFMVALPLSPATSTQQAGFKMFHQLMQLVDRRDGKLTRLCLFHPDMQTMSVALPLLLAHIRSQNLSVVVLVCVPPTSNYKLWSLVARASDVVLDTEGFASRREYPPPAEFRHLQGLLKLHKVSTVTAATANGGGFFADMTISKRPAAHMYGFKRDRRKLHIQLLHIPPEDYAEGGGSVGAGGVRSGAGKSTEKKKTNGGMGCASNSSGGSALDF